MKAVHYNFALCPDRTALPICSIGAAAQRLSESKWRVTTDHRRVTCRRCLKATKNLKNLRGVETAGGSTH